MIDPFGHEDSPTTDPVAIVIGKFTRWRREYDIDPALYSLKYVFRLAGDGTPRVVTGTKSGVYWQFEITAATSAGWSGGDYAFDIIAVRLSDDEESVVYSDRTRFFSTTDDRRSHAEIMLGKIESILVNRADNDVENYSIGSRSITKMSGSELTKWRNYYLAEVGRESASKGGPPKNRLTVRFI